MSHLRAKRPAQHIEVPDEVRKGQGSEKEARCGPLNFSGERAKGDQDDGNRKAAHASPEHDLGEGFLCGGFHAIDSLIKC